MDSLVLLRASLIGNDDLKREVLGDEKTVSDVVSHFTLALHAMVVDFSAPEALEVPKLVVIVKLLLNLPQPIPWKVLDKLQLVVPPLVALLAAYPELKRKTPLDIDLDIVINYSVDICVHLANEAGINVDWRGLALFVTLVVTDVDASAEVVTRALTLVPLIVTEAEPNSVELQALLDQLVLGLNQWASPIDDPTENVYAQPFSKDKLLTQLLGAYCLALTQLGRLGLAELGAILKPIYGLLFRALRLDATMALAAINVLALTLSRPNFPFTLLQLFPTLIDLMVLPPPLLPLFVLSPIRILADLCKQNNDLSLHLKQTNLDLQLVEMFAQRVEGDKLLTALLLLKQKTPGNAFARIPAAMIKSYQFDPIVADFLLLLLVHCATNEDNRTRITQAPEQIGFHRTLFQILDLHLWLMLQTHLLFKLVRRGCTDLGVLGGIVVGLTDNPLFTNCLYLVRLLLRLITPLRTFFVELNLFQLFFLANYHPETAEPRADGFVVSLLETLRLYESHVTILTSLKHPVNTAMVNQSLVLAVIANLSTEFLLFKMAISHYDSFLTLLLMIFREARRSASSDSKNAYAHAFIELNVLHVLRNILHVDTDENKREVWQFFELTDILNKTVYGQYPLEVVDDPELHHIYIKQKLVAFQVLRNATAWLLIYPEIVDAWALCYDLWPRSKRQHISQTWDGYLVSTLENYDVFLGQQDAVVNETDLQTWMLENLADYVLLVVTITLMEANRYEDPVEQPEGPFPSDGILGIWLRLLKCHVRGRPLEQAGSLGVENIYDVKLLILLVLINLILKELTSLVYRQGLTDYTLFETVANQGDHRAYPSLQLLLSQTRFSIGTRWDRVASMAPAQTLITELRARYLEQFGFFAVVSDMIRYFSERNRGKKFNVRNCHDLVERLSQFKHQMEVLLYLRNLDFSEAGNVHKTEAIKPLASEARRNVNRGGEGFCYDEDDDVDEDEEEDDDEEEDEEEDDEEADGDNENDSNDDEQMMQQINETLEEGWLM